MQTPIYDRFDLFITNVTKSELYGMRSAEGRPIEMEHIANTEINSEAKVIATQSHVESTIVDCYGVNREYLKKRVKMLVYKGELYLIDGHHTFIAWKLAGCTSSLLVELHRFKSKSLLKR